MFTLISSVVASVIFAKSPVDLENLGKHTTRHLIAVRWNVAPNTAKTKNYQMKLLEDTNTHTHTQETLRTRFVCYTDDFIEQHMVQHLKKTLL